MTIQGDSSHVEQILNRIQARIKEINMNTDSARANVKSLYHQGSRLAGLVLQNMKQNAVLQGIQAVQQTVQTGIAMNTVRQQAVAAWASHNYISAGILWATFGALGYNYYAAQQAERQAKLNQRYIEGIRELREGYAK